MVADDVIRKAEIQVNFARRKQTVDGFGVNINSKCWDLGKLAPVVDRLIDDLGAVLFRLDAWGKSNWVDPDDRADAKVLCRKTYEKVYNLPEFRNAMGMARHLNSRGIMPYMTMSGIVPKWMCARDGVTLTDFESFAEMAASFAEWAVRKAGIKFELFGPMNETDIGPPEGPSAGPRAYVKACEALAGNLAGRGLRNLKLVVAEQAGYNLDYTREFMKSAKLAGRIGAFGFHTYGSARMADAVKAIRRGPHRKARIWMTEFGDLDQTGEREWYVAWNSFERLMHLLDDGFEGALFWDAYDNYHDHNEHWTIYGLLRTGLGVATPKKRFHAMKQVFRFVRPGFVRVDASSDGKDVEALAFVSPDGKDLTVVGRNKSPRGAYLNISLAGAWDFDWSSMVSVYRTSETEDCAKAPDVPTRTGAWPFNGISFAVPGESIFTATSV